LPVEELVADTGEDVVEETLVVEEVAALVEVTRVVAVEELLAADPGRHCE
jgi:hypothetical protein